MILIGSKAIKQHFLDFPREPKDTDYAVEFKSDLKSTKDTEYLVNPILFKYHCSDGDLPTINVLYTLKLSHMFWDINWNKHLFDIQWLKDKGCKIIEPLFYELYNYWNEFHGNNKRSDLKMNSNEFFNNALTCEYNHDWLHTIIKTIPTYTQILKDNEEVEVDELKFNLLSFENKCNLVQEEIYVMAWERMSNMDYRFSYERMLKKFILSHAPIWEAIFILDNYKELYKPKINFKKIIENGIYKSKSVKRTFNKEKQLLTQY